MSSARLTGTAALAASALLLAGCASGSGGSAEYDPDAEVAIDFAFWGTDDRAERYNRLIDAFNEQYPNITVNVSFSDFPSYWEKRQTEVAGGGLPDVFQFSDTYLRQYGQNGALLDLAEVSDYVTTDTFDEALLNTGALDGAQYSLPTGYSLWANYVNDELVAATGVDPLEGGTSFAEYDEWMAEVTEAGDGVYGGTDYTQRIQNFELVLRADGGNLFTEDGELAFTEDDLSAFWESGDALRDGVTVPQQRLEELMPKSGFAAAATASELSWSNYLGGYIFDLGDAPVSLVAPPTAKEGAKDLYRQAGLQVAIAANAEHPEAAAIFLDFVVNSPEAGEIFGTTLGFPASETKLEGTPLEGVDKQVADYIDAAADRIGDAPPIPVAGFGSLEQKFWDLGKEIGLGTKSVDDAVTEFFAEADVILG